MFGGISNLKIIIVAILVSRDYIIKIQKLTIILEDKNVKNLSCVNFDFVPTTDNFAFVFSILFLVR